MGCGHSGQGGFETLPYEIVGLAVFMVMAIGTGLGRRVG